MILGLGSGTRSMNERWYGVEFDDPPAPRMREAAKLVRAAIAAQKGGGLRFDGRYYQIDIPQFARRSGAARGARADRVLLHDEALSLRARLTRLALGRRGDRRRVQAR
jgi:hypothetical protein